MDEPLPQARVKDVRYFDRRAFPEPYASAPDICYRDAARRFWWKPTDLPELADRKSVV